MSHEFFAKLQGQMLKALKYHKIEEMRLRNVLNFLVILEANERVKY